MRIRILIVFAICICCFNIKADDGGEVNFALQGYIKELNEATTDMERSLVLSKLITEAGRSDIDLAKAYLSKFKDLVSSYKSPMAAAI